MLSKVKQRMRYTIKKSSSAPMYKKLLEQVDSKYSQSGINKVSNHILEFDSNIDKSIIKGINVIVKSIKESKSLNDIRRNENTLLDSISKVKNPIEVKRELTTIFNTNEEFVPKESIVLYNSIKDKFVTTCIEMANYDRVIKNYNKISNRFNLDKIILSEAKSLNNNFLISTKIANLLDTYKLDTNDKAKMAIETTIFGLYKNGAPFNTDKIVSNILEYYSFIKPDEEFYNDAESIINKIKEEGIAEDLITAPQTIVANISYDNKYMQYGMNYNDKVKYYINEFKNKQDYTNDAICTLLYNIFELDTNRFQYVFKYILKIFSIVANINNENVEDYLITIVFPFIKTNIEKIGYASVGNYLNTLDDFIKANRLGIDTNELRNFCLNYSKTMLQEGGLLGKVTAMYDKFKSTISTLDDKQRVASNTLDNAIKSLKDTLTSDKEKSDREDVINDRFIPKTSQVIKVALASGVAAAINPAIAAVGLLYYAASTIANRAEERRKILNEIEVEINMTKRYIKQAEDNNQLEKIRQYQHILHELDDKRKQIRTLMAKKGESIETYSTKERED